MVQNEQTGKQVRPQVQSADELVTFGYCLQKRIPFIMVLKGHHPENPQFCGPSLRKDTPTCAAAMAPTRDQVEARALRRDPGNAVPLDDSGRALVAKARGGVTGRV